MAVVVTTYTKGSCVVHGELDFSKSRSSDVSFVDLSTCPLYVAFNYLKTLKIPTTVSYQ